MFPSKPHHAPQNEPNLLTQPKAQTFAARGSIVDPTGCTVTACSTTNRVGACLLAVTPAVVCQALVHVYTQRGVHIYTRD